MDNSGETNNVVLTVSWYSVCKRHERGKNTLLVCSEISPIKVSNNDAFMPLTELLLINMMSRWEVLEIESIKTCWLVNEDWKIKEIKDQSAATKEEVFSQLSASDNHAWSVDLYVCVQLDSRKAFKDLINYNI